MVGKCILRRAPWPSRQWDSGPMHQTGGARYATRDPPCQPRGADRVGRSGRLRGDLRQIRGPHIATSYGAPARWTASGVPRGHAWPPGPPRSHRLRPKTRNENRRRSPGVAAVHLRLRSLGGASSPATPPSPAGPRLPRTPRPWPPGPPPRPPGGCGPTSDGSLRSRRG